MSALAPKYQQYLSIADDIHSTEQPKTQPSSENVTEIVRFLQTHQSAPAPSQSTGAKDMFKAGQRRLKMALRTKKGSESKSKGEEGTRQLAALQQHGSFPRSQYRKWGHRKGAASAASSSRSLSNLSFKSESKRDIETLGRPWLEHPLERRDEPGSKASSQVSSLDLRDLACFVDAHVNFSEFDDANLAPYPSPSEQQLKPSTPVSANDVPHSFIPSEFARASSPSPVISRQSSRDLPISLRINSPAQSPIATENHKVSSYSHLGNRPSRDLKLSTPSTFAKSPSSLSPSPRSSAPTTPILKLFPDTIPPRISSKPVLRIPTPRSSTPSQPLSPVPGSQSTISLPSVVEVDHKDSRASSSSLPKIREDAPEARAREQPTSTKVKQPPMSAVESRETGEIEAKYIRRHSSLPPGAIDAFPLPAPAKPLPIVPKPSNESVGAREAAQDVPRDLQTPQPETKYAGPEPPVSLPPHINVLEPSSPENSLRSSRGRDSPFPRIVDSPQDTIATRPKPSIIPAPIQPRRGSLGKTGKTGRSREDKVRSVIMRDLASCRHQKSSSSESKTQQPERKKENQLSLPPRVDSRQAYRHYQRKISPGPSSPPPMAPPPSNPPRHTLPSRRYCRSPAATIPATIETFENRTRPNSNRNHRIYPRDSIQNEVKPERESTERGVDRPETPLPSSDDEGPVGECYWKPPRKPQGRRNRDRPAPIAMDEPASERGRTMKKQHATASREPPTPQAMKRRGLAKTSQSQLGSNDHHAYDSNGYREPEPKPNPSLEGRIEHLERQNKILQAALLAALDVGVKQDLSSLLQASAVSLPNNVTPPLTGRSFSSTTNTSASEYSVRQNGRPCTAEAPYHPDSWRGSTGTFDRSHYDSDEEETRKLEEMIDEFDLDWLSDRSSVMGQT
ncbi:hypothetical protein BJY04DRAFT_233259 [Aspergillus karnatakaensis]|uniref:uncharacterized protein n=1 Tax=Aspergillus karnatakaensis TaxID=1810916 RepID=UPI003CCCE26A